MCTVLPSIPPTQDGYTSTPDRVRVYADELDETWNVDGIDTRQPAISHRPDGRPVHPYTEQVWRFETFQQAHRAVPEFYARHINH